MTIGIYKITNTQTNKCYIGSSVKIEQRWVEHRSDLRRNKHHSQYLQRSWNKRGEEHFSFEIIETLDNTDDLLPREQHYMDLYESYKKENGYNSVKTAGNTLGFKHSEESKALMSRQRTGLKRSAETKAKMSKAQKGRTAPSLETRAKMSASAVERCKRGISDETRSKMSEAHKGRTAWNKGIPQTEEAKKKISDALKGRPSPNKGNKHTEETKAKMSRERCGTGNSRSIFTEEQVREIRRLNKEGISQRKLAAMFGCSRGAIVSAIKKYKNVK